MKSGQRRVFQGRLVLFAVSAILLILVLGATLWQRAHRAPRIDASTRSIDAGVVVKGSIVRRRFELKNRGTAPLTIGQVTTDCACTATVMSASEVNPGDMAFVDVAIDTSLQATLDTRVAKMVHVASNDPREPVLALQVVLSVEPEFDVSDSVVDFESSQDSKSREKRITIDNRKGHHVEFLAASTTDKSISVEIRKGRPDSAHAAELLVRQLRDARIGDYAAVIVVKTSSPLSPEIRIPVWPATSSRGRN